MISEQHKADHKNAKLGFKRTFSMELPRVSSEEFQIEDSRTAN